MQKTLFKKKNSIIVTLKISPYIMKIARIWLLLQVTNTIQKKARQKKQKLVTTNNSWKIMNNTMEMSKGKNTNMTNI